MPHTAHLASHLPPRWGWGWLLLCALLWVSPVAQASLPCGHSQPIIPTTTPRAAAVLVQPHKASAALLAQRPIKHACCVSLWALPAAAWEWDAPVAHRNSTRAHAVVARLQGIDARAPPHHPPRSPQTSIVSPL